MAQNGLECRRRETKRNEYWEKMAQSLNQVMSHFLLLRALRPLNDGLSPLNDP